MLGITNVIVSSLREVTVAFVSFHFEFMLLNYSGVCNVDCKKFIVATICAQELNVLGMQFKAIHNIFPGYISWIYWNVTDSLFDHITIWEN